MPLFLRLLAPLAKRGIPVIRIRPNSKAAMDSGWPDLATTNLKTYKNGQMKPRMLGVGCVAKAEIGATWFLELDAAGEALRIKNETQKEFPKTFLIRRRPGRGHLYFKQNAASIAMGNITQPQIKGAGFSVRVQQRILRRSRQFLHPATGLPLPNR